MMRKHDLLEKQKTKKEKNPEKKGLHLWKTMNSSKTLFTLC